MTGKKIENGNSRRKMIQEFPSSRKLECVLKRGFLTPYFIESQKEKDVVGAAGKWEEPIQDPLSLSSVTRGGLTGTSRQRAHGTQETHGGIVGGLPLSLFHQ